MKHWQKQSMKNKLTIAAAFLLALSLSAALIFSFNQYKKQIIKEQEEQLLTIAQTVANSISLYLDFYFSDLVFLNTYEEYLDAGKIYLEKGDKEPIHNFLTTHQKFQNDDVSNYFITKKNDDFSEEHILIQGNEDSTYTSVNHFAGKKMGSRIDILKDEQGQYHLGISMPTLTSDLRLFLVINIERMYQQVASYIKVGENGYLIIKDSTGLILMHPVKKQIGADVIDGRKNMYPNYDLTELEKLIDHQLQGKEGVEIYHSYWWADEIPKRVKKIAAYTPLWFQDNFMVISAVIDYNEIAQPISKAMFTIFFLTIAIVTAFAIMLYQLRNSLLARTKVEQENEYLRKLNSKLEELRNCEEQISHDQRLQLIGTLTGGIAHEFNNLLTPIMGYSGMLMVDRPEEDDVYQSAEEIYSAAEKAKEIIRQIASLSRKQPSTAFVPLNIRKATEGVLRVIDSVTPPNMHVTVQMNWDKDCFICCSETGFNQVVLNLCTNAFYAMRGTEGTLQLRGNTINGYEAEELIQTTKHYDNYISIAIEDNGEGIRPDHLAHIFDPFFTTKQVGEGTGLGLSTVQSILESANGGIRVESNLGEGTCFTIYLPICKTDIPLPIKRVHTKSIAKDYQKKILLVEDDKKILKMFNTALTTAGFIVTALNNPLDAKQHLIEEHFDVIVTDYAMPKMTGTQIASLARELGKACKVILITGLVEDNILEYYHKNFIHMLLLKPLECQTLIDAINQEIGSTNRI